MTLKIDLPPEVEQALQERAQRTGQSVAEFAAAFLAQLPRLNRENRSMEEQAEIAERLMALGRFGCYDTRTRAGLPALSDEAVSRESIYEGRGL